MLPVQFGKAYAFLGNDMATYSRAKQFITDKSERGLDAELYRPDAFVSMDHVYVLTNEDRDTLDLYRQSLKAEANAAEQVNLQMSRLVYTHQNKEHWWKQNRMISERAFETAQFLKQQLSSHLLSSEIVE